MPSAPDRAAAAITECFHPLIVVSVCREPGMRPPVSIATPFGSRLLNSQNRTSGAVYVLAAGLGLLFIALPLGATSLKLHDAVDQAVVPLLPGPYNDSRSIVKVLDCASLGAAPLERPLHGAGERADRDLALHQHLLGAQLRDGRQLLAPGGEVVQVGGARRLAGPGLFRRCPTSPEVSIGRRIFRRPPRRDAARPHPLAR